jgi:hypothetical protein
VLRLVPLGIDHRVFLFALVTAACGTALFALLPAWQAARLSLTDALRGQGGDARRGAKLQHALITGQVAVSLVLVIVALTLVRNTGALRATDLGYDTRGVIAVHPRSGTGLVPRLASVLEGDPRIAEVAVSARNPLFVRARVIAAAPEQGPAIATRYTFVSPEYFSVLRIRVDRGRGFRHAEAAAGAAVAVVSAGTAQTFWPGADPVGRTIRILESGEPANRRRRVRSFANALRLPNPPVDDLAGYSHALVIGMVQDVVSGWIVDGRDTGHIYLPISTSSPHAQALLVRERSTGALNPEEQHELFERAAADAQLVDAIPLEEKRAMQVYPFLAVASATSVLGFVALGLSLGGLYGVLTYLLSQRTREIGIRMALGASAAIVTRLVLWQSGHLAALGAALGVLGAFGVLKVLSAGVRLDAIRLLEPWAFAAGLAVVVVTTAIAALYPARRATRVDPARALRAEG